MGVTLRQAFQSGQIHASGRVPSANHAMPPIITGARAASSERTVLRDASTAAATARAP